MLRAVRELESVLGDGGFWTALLVGIVGAAFVWARLRRGVHEPGIAVLAAVACLLGLWVDERLPAALVVALALLVAGEWWSRARRSVARAVATIPGALVLAVALPDGCPFWIRAVVVAVTVASSVLVERTQRALPRLVPVLFAIGAVGVYFCVPDTEAPKALLGALVAAAALGLEPRLRPALGAPALAGLFVWVGAVGGIGRPGSVVGAVACLGVLVLVPLVRRSVHTLLVVALQCALVLYSSRVAGLEQSAWTAFALCVPAFVAAGALLVVADRFATRR
jgi:hypothetical protein